MSPVRLSIVLLLVGGSASAQTPLRSGPQPKEEILTAFRPLNINGEYANEPHCLVCENGANPVVMIFARDRSDGLVNLVTKLEAATEKHRKESLGAFVVFLKDGEAFRKGLEEVAKMKRLKNTILSIEDPANVEDYKVAKEADVTVVLYTKSVVQANHAFKRGELNDRAIETILADLPKILPKK
jgi:hypothetical protein